MYPHKSGCILLQYRSYPLDPLDLSLLRVKLGQDDFHIPMSLSVFITRESNGSHHSTRTKYFEYDGVKRTGGSRNVGGKQERSADRNSRVQRNCGQDVVDPKAEREEQKKNEDEVVEDPVESVAKKVRVRGKTSAALLRNEKSRVIERRRVDWVDWEDDPEARKRLPTCDVCDKTFKEKNKLSRHMRKHSNSRTCKCAICFQVFKYRESLTRHMKTHKGPAQLHGCSLCNFKANAKYYLKIHYIRKHTEAYKFSCEQCGKMFKIQSDYKTHVKDHETESCMCDICGTSYPRKSSLYNHKRYKHTAKIKEFECTICRKRYKSQKNLEIHAELHKMKYVCEQCGMEFSMKNALTKHLGTHSREKSYLCTKCGKTFGSLNSQKMHLLTHMGERPYVCDICGQSFTQRSPMMVHRKKHPGVHPPPPPIKIANLLLGAQDKVHLSKNKAN